MISRPGTEPINGVRAWRLACAISVSFLLTCVGCQGANAAPDQSEAALRNAEKVIKGHRLLTASEFQCSTLLFRGMNGGAVAQIGVLERHGDGCPGDPDTAPRRFDLEINLKTGAAKWDNNGEMDMLPIPR